MIYQIGLSSASQSSRRLFNPTYRLYRVCFSLADNVITHVVDLCPVCAAVRVGDLSAFTTALSSHQKRFSADGTYTLILRLRHNVIKTALRSLSLAYSRIPLQEICKKLHLEGEEEAEYVCAKAIRDGVIEASLEHEKGFMKSKDVADIYATNEPQKAFHQRIGFCLQLHNESIKVRLLFTIYA